MRDHLVIIPRLTRADVGASWDGWTELRHLAPRESRTVSSPPGGLVEIFPELMTESESDMDLMAINWMIILHVKNGETNRMMEQRT